MTRSITATPLTIVPRQIVLDASAAVALLADAGPAGQWVEATIRGARLLAPDLMPFEVSNILRRHALAGILDQSAATLAHTDLIALPIDLYPYVGLAERVWELRVNLTVYDASYVALAELATVPLVTLDARLARAPATRCQVLAYSQAP
ncbi:MAG: type II toxin-antitoxin system VapC family toxin [Micromonosporaceae bacterium]|nr:type II toxin-antitoxin system VapC family toxin [Micromonosporaceae bacterium]